MAVEATHYEQSLFHLGKADEYRDRDNMELGYRLDMIARSEHLALVHAVLHVGEVIATGLDFDWQRERS